MSYLWLWISILYATMQINNQSAVSRAFLIVCVCVGGCVCVRVQPCVPIKHVLSISMFLTTETVMSQNKVTVSLSPVSSMTIFHGC